MAATESISAPFNQIVVDIGNSAVKIGGIPYSAANSAGLEAVTRIAGEPVEVMLSACAMWCDRFAAEQSHWIVASVVPKLSESLADFVRTQRPRDTLHAITWRDVPLAIEWDDPESLGIDRLLAALAATKFCPDAAWRSVVVVDFGTATTIDVVRYNSAAMPTFVGGFIVPGIATALRSLNAATAALPLISPRDLRSDEIAFPARSTASAMASGVVTQTVAAVNWVYSQELHQSQDAVAILLTGGDADIVADVLVKNCLAENGLAVTVQPNLVLRGAAMIALRHSRVGGNPSKRQ
ncbi:MAG: type III pantothenate kinase [Thermoguttaceae bacterium]